MKTKSTDMFWKNETLTQDNEEISTDMMNKVMSRLAEHHNNIKESLNNTPDAHAQWKEAQTFSRHHTGHYTFDMQEKPVKSLHKHRTSLQTVRPLKKSLTRSLEDTGVDLTDIKSNDDVLDTVTGKRYNQDS